MRGFLLNWVLTASLLIGAVVLLRWVFGHRISARLRYALWPQAKYIEFGYWDAEGRFLPVSA